MTARLRFRLWTLVLPGLVCLGLLLSALPAWGQAASGRIVVEDFEGYAPGDPLYRWKRPHMKDRALLDLSRELERDDDYIEIVAEGGSQGARIYTRDNTEQLVRMNGDGYDWDLQTHPRLSWRWRATHLPAGAREDKKGQNDTGGAIYVTFDRKDWIGRPHTLKYTYSSTLPVGTTMKYGAMRVIVVSSGADGAGTWQQIDRDVASDYRTLFGKEPPDRPGYLMLWGDSDTTHGLSEVFIDDLVLLPAAGR